MCMVSSSILRLRLLSCNLEIPQVQMMPKVCLKTCPDMVGFYKTEPPDLVEQDFCYCWNLFDSHPVSSITITSEWSGGKQLLSFFFFSPESRTAKKKANSGFPWHLPLFIKIFSVCVRTGLCFGFRANSKTGLRQASFTILMFCVFLFWLVGFVFCFVFNSSRLEGMAFVHCKFVAFITSTFIKHLSAFFFFPLSVLKQIFWVMPLIFNSLPFRLLLAVLVWLVKISLRCRDASGATAWGRAWSCGLFLSRTAGKVKTA